MARLLGRELEPAICGMNGMSARDACLEVEDSIRVLCCKLSARLRQPLHPSTPRADYADSQAQVFKNVAGLLAASGTDKSHVLKTTCFLKDMNDFADFNTLYAEFFGETKPARSCVEVARLPKDVLVEVEFIATEKK